MPHLPHSDGRHRYGPRPARAAVFLLLSLFLLYCPRAAALTIQWVYGGNLRNLQASDPAMYATITAGLDAGASLVSATFSNPIAITFAVDSFSSGNILGSTSSSSVIVPYADVQSRLPGLPPTPPPINAGSSNQIIDSSRTQLTVANAQALGLDVGPPGIIGGSIVISTAFSWDPNQADGISSGAYDLTGVVAHELFHGLGVVSSGDLLAPGATGTVTPYLMDLYRWASPGVRSMAPNTPAYFSPDGSETGIVFHPASASHLNSSTALMRPVFAASTLIQPTGEDIPPMEAIGWVPAGASVDAKEPPPVSFLAGALLAMLISRRLGHARRRLSLAASRPSPGDTAPAASPVSRLCRALHTTP